MRPPSSQQWLVDVYLAGVANVFGDLITPIGVTSSFQTTSGGQRSNKTTHQLSYNTILTAVYGEVKIWSEYLRTNFTCQKQRVHANRGLPWLPDMRMTSDHFTNLPGQYTITRMSWRRDVNYTNDKTLTINCTVFLFIVYITVFYKQPVL